jgi:hypothetical protein
LSLCIVVNNGPKIDVTSESVGANADCIHENGGALPVSSQEQLVILGTEIKDRVQYPAIVVLCGSAAGVNLVRQFL